MLRQESRREPPRLPPNGAGARVKGGSGMIGNEVAGKFRLVLTFARVLHANGQSTDETLAATERLGNNLDLRARIIPRWGELQLQAGDGGAGVVSVAAADPTGVDMDRVASAMRAIDEVGAG